MKECIIKVKDYKKDSSGVCLTDVLSIHILYIVTCRNPFHFDKNCEFNTYTENNIVPIFAESSFYIEITPQTDKLAMFKFKEGPQKLPVWQ